MHIINNKAIPTHPLNTDPWCHSFLAQASSSSTVIVSTLRGTWMDNFHLGDQDNFQPEAWAYSYLCLASWAMFLVWANSCLAGLNPRAAPGGATGLLWNTRSICDPDFPQRPLNHLLPVLSINLMGSWLPNDTKMLMVKIHPLIVAT